MHRSLVVSGVLGLGPAIVFGAAALAATLFPNSYRVPPAPGQPAEKGDIVVTDQP